ncbi:uncharacterized protein LOC112526827 [Cynara cardunculus var. scolymus]|uniref:Uncharacterized protein n=1 Tax=Cynara cardunculus var. scolymus TaxID=59895 RepID=A0A124SB55_CYNCS|nr:uncharacterized protein LOC112526827 [Cynara cardunculus var. scolymus]KVH89575.1 hypothetical protein Ccrd_008436 [Cynara cardunculus var. scolymus]
MGCFVSTNKTSQSSKFHQHSSRSSRAPPPVDVETVKEVLSETPNPNPFMKMENDPKKIRQDHNVLEDPNISEIGSNMSECVSTATLDDDIDVYRRKVIDRSPSKSRNRHQLSGELQPVRKSPARAKEQSPSRVKLVPERNNRGNGFGSAGRQRPGSGNVSAARSRSPANRTVAGGDSGGRNEIGRSLSCRRTGKSPGRVVSDLNERVRKPDFRSGRVREEGSWPPTATNNDELLENPLVSLECFIFL